jgi:hypothetical protein
MKTVLVLSVLMFALAVHASAEYLLPQQTMSYQGVLRDAETGQVILDGDYEVTFRLYTQEEGGNVRWEETRTIHVKHGVFNVILGEVTPLDFYRPFFHQYWLSIEVENQGELDPRVKLAASPYAHRARSAGTFYGLAFGQGPQETTLVFPHGAPFTIVVAEQNAHPESNGIGFVHCVENDAWISWAGFDGNGNQVRGSAGLSSETTILTTHGGDVVLRTPGDGSRTLKLLTTDTYGQHVSCRVIW